MEIRPNNSKNSNIAGAIPQNSTPKGTIQIQILSRQAGSQLKQQKNNSLPRWNNQQSPNNSTQTAKNDLIKKQARFDRTELETIL